jgi:hypothetical protein
MAPESQGLVLVSVTLPMSDLSTNLTVEHFNQFERAALKPDSSYWIDLNTFGPVGGIRWLGRNNRRIKRRRFKGYNSQQFY